MQRSLVFLALDMDVTGRATVCRVAVTRHRGTQYTSGGYQKAFQKVGATCRMSRKGNCWDNVPTESFFATLKRELVYRTYFGTWQEAISTLFRWITVCYNRKHHHSMLG